MTTRFGSLIALLGLWLALACWPAAAAELGVVPTRIIYPNEIITADALAMAKVRKGKPTTTAFAHETGELVGKIARRTLLPNRFVPLTAVRDPFLVQQGASVQVLYVQSGLTITLTGVLLEPGSTGDTVKVRNTDSGAVFSATIMADGTARVGDG